MERKLVKTKKQLVKNILTFDGYIYGKSESKRKFALERIREGQIFIPYKISGKIRFAPLTFVGFQNNTKEKYSKNPDEMYYSTTNKPKPAVTKVLGHDSSVSSESNKFFEAYCNSLEIKYKERKISRRFWNPLENLIKDITILEYRKLLVDYSLNFLESKGIPRLIHSGQRRIKDGEISIVFRLPSRIVCAQRSSRISNSCNCIKDIPSKKIRENAYLSSFLSNPDHFIKDAKQEIKIFLESKLNNPDNPFWEKLAELDKRESSTKLITPEKIARRVLKKKVILQNRDYLKIHKRNTELGKFGEELVIEYEKDQLEKLGLSDLAKQVEKKPDGAGYDILSFNKTGNEVYIEVKTTTGNVNTPFYLSINELETCKSNRSKYKIYRLFEYQEKQASFFIIEDLLDMEMQASEFKVFPNKQ